MPVSSKELSALSRLFSSTVFRGLLTKGKSAAFVSLAREGGVLPRPRAGVLVRDVFDAAFEVLKHGGSRDEYIYKAALTHRVLLGRHNLRTACMLSEFRTGECKVDIAILNGTMTAYEIKSERDSLSRLQRQIASYCSVFASVFVIAGENHVEAVLRETPPEVGVLSLNRRYSITTRRNAQNVPGRVSPRAVFETLRTNEVEVILTKLGVPVPCVPNTQRRAALGQSFERLRPDDIHAAMLDTLKHTRNMAPLSNLVGQLPKSLQPVALLIPHEKRDHDRLIAAIDTPMEQALTWS